MWPMHILAWKIRKKKENHKSSFKSTKKHNVLKDDVIFHILFGIHNQDTCILISYHIR